MKLNLIYKRINNNLTQFIETSYDTETKEKIYKIIHKIQLLNPEMFNELSLTPHKTFESRILQSQSVYLWSILVGSTSKKLSRYGDLTQEQCKFIDDYVFRIVGLIEKLKEFN